MDTEEIVRLLPLVRKDLSSSRTEFHRAITLSSVMELVDKQAAFSDDEVLLEVRNRFGFDSFPKFVVIDALENLVAEGVIKKKDTRFVLAAPVIERRPEVVSVAFKEFQEYLKEEVPSYDPYLNASYEQAFRLAFEEFVAILGKSTEMSGQIIENVHAMENRESLRHAVSRVLGDRESPEFVELFLGYASAGRPVFSEALIRIYQGIVIVDLLGRGKDLAECVGKFGSGCRLFMDTNVITASLCPKNPKHGLTVATLQHARSLGFELVYSPYTKLEFNNLLKMANAEMTTPAFSFKVKENEIVTDFLGRDVGQSWFERFTELCNYEKTLGILFDAKVEGISIQGVSDAEESELRASLTTIIRVSGRTRSADAISHDVRMYRAVRPLRHEVPGCCFPEPWIVTLDNFVVAFDELERQRHKAEFGIIMHVRTLLSSLVPFWNPSLEATDRARIVSGVVMNLMVPPRFTLTIDEYSRLLTHKLGLDARDASVLLRILTLSPLKDKLAEALQEENADGVTSMTIATLTESKVVEEIVAKDKEREEKEDALRKLKLVTEKYLIGQAELGAYKKIASRPVVVLIQTGLPQGVPEMLLAAVERIKEENPKALDEAGVSESDLQSGSIQKVRRFVTKLEEWTNRAGNLAGSIGSLAPVLRYILASIPPLA